MKQQQTLMKFDPATGEPKPYPSHADQWREWHGKATAWLFNPWTGTRRDARDVGSDIQGQLILPPSEPLYAARAQSASCGVEVLAQGEITGGFAPMASTEARYRDLLQRLGVQGHDGAVAEISKLREAHGLEG